MTWLASASPGVGGDEQTFILTAARSPYSFLLVESVVPGWSLVVRDLLMDRQFRVVEHEIAARVQCEDVLFSAILTIDGVSTLLGYLLQPRGLCCGLSRCHGRARPFQGCSHDFVDRGGNEH